MFNPFRQIAQGLERSNQLVAAKTEFYEACVELNYRRSRGGRKYHGADSIEAQYQHAMSLREDIRRRFGVVEDAPEH